MFVFANKLFYKKLIDMNKTYKQSINVLLCILLGSIHGVPGYTDKKISFNLAFNVKSISPFPV